MKTFKQIMSTSLVAFVTMMSLAGCQTEAPANTERTEQTQTTPVEQTENSDVTSSKMVDREGNEFEAPASIERILSTAPSNTEVLIALGLADNLVGVDKYSTDIEGIPAEAQIIDFRNPDAEAIIAMEPDIIIASGHNKVGDEDPYALLKEAGITVVYIPSSDSIQGIYEDIAFIAEITETESKGQELIDEMKQEVEAIKEIANTITEQKTVYFEIGSSSNLYSFGHSTFLNELIETVGATNILASEEGWISPSEEAIITANPDVILTNEGYLENPTQLIKERAGFEGITAVENDAIYLIDKNASSRGSQNVIKALKEMAEAIYPEYYAN